MKPKNCLIFGASGFIGRNLIRKLTQNNYKVTAVTRNLHQKAYILKTQANPGYLDIVESSIFDAKNLRTLIKSADICLNCIGILTPKNKINNFENIHEKFPALISSLCQEYNVKQFIHLSTLGIDRATDSLYAKSKLNGEIYIKKNCNTATILRPSVIFGYDDSFSTNLMTLLNRLPIFPLYYAGKTLFTPIHISDLVEIIFQIIEQNINSMTIECIGPEEISFKNILLRLLKLIRKKRLLVSLPLSIAKLSANFFQLFPNPLITIDQLRLLKYPNIISGKYKTNFDLKIPSYANFDIEVEKYCYMWREAGQFSQNKLNDNNEKI